MVGNCNKFHFVEKDETCDTIAALYSISASQFLQWNPAAKADCSGLWASTYACVGIIGGTPPATTTRAGNGITTPTPVHPGMVSNCNKFAYVNPGDTCDGLASLYHISTSDLVSWNAGIGGKDCRSLQANTFICIGVTGGTPTSTGNGIPTPTPTQSGMVKNCNKFVYVNPGDTCAGIASKNSISVDNFVKWNGGVGGKDCRGLQAYTYACVGVKG
ncbi:carbohydrate-binding module family 50 protein [Thermothelomyces thermophilus ATCC 42464]|uniref:Carbohydrate-binding module family 50 protein n=1 Tax=Thermothelomyces thermophilus (strain ATCC 42464 / BCRC 31852 / DSM 1799) TaxID=573729 RepID=G2QGV6_THET4|nr:carbohydrate-binding module family 50 protein [Thermothelomyces thermophilus ATCC 42464]AEO59463.1 carbohydrate-binding module family 50 protein [Thermothelomyces thermophilus ATCC 42464]